MLDARRKGAITASEIGAICGVGRFNTADDILKRKILEELGTPEEFQTNAAMDWGHEHEQDAVDMFAFEHGGSVEKTGENQEFRDTMITVTVSGNDVEYRAGCTPDGIVNGDTVLEIKCPFGKRNQAPDAEKYLADVLEYRYQVQWQMMITGLQSCWLCVWTTHGISTIRIDADPELQAELQQRGGEFTARLRALLADADARDEFLSSCDVDYRDDADFANAVAEYTAANDAATAAEKALKTAREKLIGICKKSTRGCGVSVTKTTRAGAVQYDKIPELNGVDLSKYRKKPTTVWSVRHVK